MQLQPRYNGDPVLVIEGVGDPSAALLRQRRRLLDALEAMTDEQWGAQSRCDEWSTQGVITHLISTDQFWGISMRAGLKGEPTQFLGTFDPVKSPAEMVRQRAAMTPSDVLAQFRESVASFAAVLDCVADDQWEAVVAEAPPGHIALGATALHALWDGWIHERDILLPLGRTPVEDETEMELILRYAAGLGPAFNAASGGGKVGTLGVEASDPSVSFVVEADTTVRVRDGRVDGPRLQGRTVDLIEALSYRAPLHHDLGADDAWLVTGLGTVFDVQP
ncbi:MAG: maleylpyruvate isomerase family mycothiol-dependent enzyme [Acidimicrobiales bacterium]|nr:maleylpyruvate isomerase family mycothiol-dependent enzyme [Acidimicrobiales bacterium]